MIKIEDINIKLKENGLEHITCLEINTKGKSKFYCSKHKETFYKIHNHCIKSKGCPSCSRESYNSKRSQKIDDLIPIFNEVHNLKYTYPKQDIKSCYDRIKIICPIHGEFKQQVSVHKHGSGCPLCKSEKIKNNFSYSFEKWVEILSNIHDNKYNYVDEFKDKKMKIICPIHGEFWQNPAIHKMGHGCPKCAVDKNPINKKLSTEEWIKRARKKWGEVYDYSKVKYKGAKNKIEIICKKHGKFLQTPNDHLCGCGCPNCFTKSSRAEDEICDYLRSIKVDFKRHDRQLLKPKEVDIYLKDFNLAIEYNGNYWHSYTCLDNKNYHKDKLNELSNKGINLFNIYEYQWLNKKDIIKSMLKSKLGQGERIYARNTEIRVLNNHDYKNFCNENHLQGSKNSKVKIGLYYKDEIVSCMSFSKNKKYEWELDRFCNKLNLNVIGGASKLFKYFINNYNPTTILSYCSRDYSNGNLYEKLNFKLDGFTPPNYGYIRGKKFFSRQTFRKNKLKKLLKTYDESLSETENMFKNGYRILFNTGNYRFIFRKD